METFSFEQLETEGELVVGGATAAEVSARIVARARAQAAAIADEARARGHEEGLVAGRAEALAQLEPAAGALAAAVSAVENVRDEMVVAVERRVLELALALGEKVIGAALGARPELVLEVVGSALRRSVVRDQLVLEVNPDDLELVRGSVGQLVDRLGGFHGLEVVSERRVPRGGCVVRSSEGEIDARIGEQLARAEELLRDALAAEPGRA